MHLRSFDYFRALAILVIIGNHCYGLSDGWRPTTVFGKFNVNLLIFGGETFFTFISGFLFYRVYYHKIDYKNFMINRMAKVLYPYLFISCILVFLVVFILRTGPYPEYFFPPNHGIFYQYIRPFVLYIVTGRALWGYWYVPFIMLVYVLSPFFAAYIRWSFKMRVAVMLGFFLTATLIHRPVGNINIFQAVLYYLPVYLLGIMASMHKDEIYGALKNRELLLLAPALLLCFVQAAFYTNYEYFFKDAFTLTVVDISIIQKSILCLFFMVWLHRFENKKSPLLSKIADVSFMLYLIHPIILTLLKHGMRYSHKYGYPSVTYLSNVLNHPGGLFVYFLVVFSVCFIFTLTLPVIQQTIRRVGGTIKSSFR